MRQKRTSIRGPDEEARAKLAERFADRPETPRAAWSTQRRSMKSQSRGVAATCFERRLHRRPPARRRSDRKTSPNRRAGRSARGPAPILPLFRPHAKRHDADDCAVALDHQHAQLLRQRVMVPRRLEPLERLEERVARRLRAAADSTSRGATASSASSIDLADLEHVGGARRSVVANPSLAERIARRSDYFP